MALPKNFNQLEKRVESLNDLTFYKASYEFEFTEEFKESLKEGDETSQKISEQINGLHEFSALDDEKAETKLRGYLKSLVENKIITDFDVVDLESMTFGEKIVEKNLDKILSK